MGAMTGRPAASAAPGRGNGPAAQARTMADVAMAVSLRADSAPHGAPPRAIGGAKWIGPGRTVWVHGFEIPGMVYVGSGMPANPREGGGPNAPGLIDPAAIVTPTAAGTPYPEMGYWPSYSTVSPQCRYAYLRWLSEGRPACGNVGYIFLWFYAAERRLLAENPLPGEVAQIAGEIERLRRLHGNRSLLGYSLGLLETIRIKALLSDPGTLERWRPAPETESAGRVMPLAMKLAVACRVAAGEPLPFELALAGVLSTGRGGNDWSGRLAVTRTPGEFTALVRARFANAFPEGFPLQDRNTSMELVPPYTPAARGLALRFAVAPWVRRLPDPDSLLWTGMERLAGQAAADLDAYARTVGNNRNNVSDIGALALLPDELSGLDPGGARQALLAWLGGLPRPVAAVPWTDLAARCTGRGDTPYTARNITMAAGVLERAGYGLEPDPRHGAKPAKPGVPLRVFPVDTAGQADTKLPAAWERGVAAATIIASSGAGGSPAAPDWLAAVAAALGLGSGVSLRLTAHFGWLADRRPSAAEAKRRAGALAEPERLHLAQVLTASIHGGIDEAGSLAILEKAYDHLGADRKALYLAYHTAAVPPPAREPVSVSVSGGSGPSPLYRIPPPPDAPPGKRGGALDAELIRRIQDETREVSAVLADIYRDEHAGDGEHAPDPPQAPPGSRFAGLDAEHAALAAALAVRTEWPRAEYEAEARSRGLLPDGAMETLNMWAYEVLGDALADDGDDPILINTALLPPGDC